MTSYRSLAPLLALVVLLTGYSFMSASWTAAPGAPTGNNADQPINVGTTTQTKQGNFSVNILTAAVSTWSPQYCDENGANCWDPATGAPGGGGDTITIGGMCFRPATAVTCNWNWSGDGNDNSTYIIPITWNAGQHCANLGRSYQYQNMILARC
jgi:hypothetical protein